jgi:hypothetical protein
MQAALKHKSLLANTYSTVELCSLPVLVIKRVTISAQRLIFISQICGLNYMRSQVLQSSWNVMARGDAREGKWRGNWRMEWVASNLHTTSEHDVSSITTADSHTSAAISRLTWRPRRLKWTRPFRRRQNLVSARVPSHFKRSLLLQEYAYHVEMRLVYWMGPHFVKNIAENKSCVVYVPRFASVLTHDVIVSNLDRKFLDITRWFWGFSFYYKELVRAFLLKIKLFSSSFKTNTCAIMNIKHSNNMHCQSFLTNKCTIY